MHDFTKLEKTRIQTEHRAEQKREGACQKIVTAVAYIHGVEDKEVVVLIDCHFETDYRAIYHSVTVFAQLGQDSRVRYEYNAPTEQEALDKAVAGLKSMAGTLRRWKETYNEKPEPEVEDFIPEREED